MKKLSCFSILIFLGCIILAIPGFAEAESNTEGAASEPGIVFTGPIKISGKASGGSISLVVSEKRDTITKIAVTLHDLKCNVKHNGQDKGASLESWYVEQGGNVPNTKDNPPAAVISKGKFKASSPGAFQVEGKFAGKKSATGTIHLTYTYRSYYPSYESWSCDLGTWKWEAKTH